MATEVVRPKALQNILTELPERYYEWDGAGVVYDDQFYLYDEYGEHVPETTFHSNLNRYLFEVLRWFYRNYSSAVFQFLEYRFDQELSELEVQARQARYKPDSPQAKAKVRRVKVEPDLALFLDDYIGDQDEASFSIGEGKELPSPNWLLETASRSTYQRDLEVKFRIYQEVLKVKEYVVFDPHKEQLWEGSRLRGWQLENGVYIPLKQDAQGRHWSELLQSWLVVEGYTFRLYDAMGQLRLTEAEHERAEAEQARAEAQRERAEAERERTEKERERAEKETAQRRIVELEARLKVFEAREGEKLQ